VTPSSASAIIVRPLLGDAENDGFFSLAAATFPGYLGAHCGATPHGSLASGWRHFKEEAPDFEPSNLRGAFLDGALVGGYLHDERWLRIGDAQLRTGYVGGVVTDPARRGLGIASALMRDGVTRASARGQTLLVLRGIADFYHQFGYADVMEVTEHAVERQRVQALHDPGVCVRAASLDDAPALLELHARHYYPFSGSYTRSCDQQRHLLLHRSSPPLLAVDRDGRPCGYLLLPCGSDRSVAVEVAADTWPAALALLHHHASSADTTSELNWPLPFGSPTYHQLADNLPLTSRTTSRPNAGWMARVASLGELCAGLMPVWQQRWLRAASDWVGALTLEVENVRCHLQLSHGLLQRLQAPPDGAPVVHLTSGVLAQLVFGYRPAAWAASRADQSVAAQVIPALAALFPTATAWYAGSNRC